MAGILFRPGSDFVLVGGLVFDNVWSAKHLEILEETTARVRSKE